MKKLCLLILAAMCVANGFSQKKIIPLDGFWDNWYGGVMTGAIYSHSNKKAGPAIGLELGKQITPAFGMSLQGISGFSYLNSRNAFEDINLTVNGKLNFMNLFGGYKGEPRLFEVEGIVGVGMLHEFYPATQRNDNNLLSFKAGAALNFNLGKEKRWTLGIRPAVGTTVDGKHNEKMKYSPRLELLAGIVYNFKCGNDRRHHEVIEAYGQDDIDRMNTNINELRGKVNSLNDEIKEKDNQNENLKTELNDCTKELNETKEKMIDTFVEPVISFRQSEAKVENIQMPNIENIVKYMEKYPKLKVKLKGYASPEGNREFNKRLAENRAKAVKKILVEKYNMDEKRIEASGMGVGENFSEPEMNRAVIVTFER